MQRIALVNMPFAALQLPSLALTQLKAAIDAEFAGAIDTRICYLNHEFGKYFGVRTYQSIANGGPHLYSGFGDWLFRGIAFPDAPDNADSYFTRYYPDYQSDRKGFRRVATVKRAGVDRLLDALIDHYQLDQVDLVGFTSMFAQNVGCFAMARKIKARNPNIRVVMGGANCESPMGQTLLASVPQIDVVFSGPALQSFPEYLRRLMAGALDAHDPPINGVFGRTTAGAPARELGDERDINAPVPLHYGEFVERILTQFPDGAVKPVVLFETSRGCWWGQKAHCTFCGLNGSTMTSRAMAPDLAIRQFQELFRYADRVPRFECVDNILPKSYLRDVLPHLRTPEHVSLFYEVKADLSEDDFRVLTGARVIFVQPGIESLATATLKLMRKGTTAFTNLRFLSNCAVYGVRPAWNLLMGFPGETAETYDKYLADIPRLAHLPPPTGAFPVRFDRFSPYFEQPGEYELDLQPMDMYEFVYPFDAETRAGLAYYFSDRNYSAPYAANVARVLPRVQKAVATWHARYQGKDGMLPADLFAEPEGPPGLVHDSRSGVAVTHHLTAVMTRLLEHLRTPGRLGDLEKHMPGATVAELEGALAGLREKHLLFEEGDRLMSLVLPRRAIRVTEAQW